MDREIKVLRAAVYTRKSSEEGLELEYNSLDAQRDSCRAYIQSQKHEGWELVDREYSDGGISGGTLNRPALQELLQDIKNGLVDIIVVYKIDRLTRSLHDFSKLVEVFDKYNTSFVSITQQFNTSTSMGRLTLNMLLSFAQFEREVTGERIRDKKKAMAMKGMWSAGVTPFGYDRVEKKLVPNPDHAERVRKIFDLYIELRSVNAVKKRLQKLNIQTQNRRDWSDGNLYNILQRQLYIGKIEYKSRQPFVRSTVEGCTAGTLACRTAHGGAPSATHKEVYDGQHEAIVDKEIFRKVQQIISENRRRSASKLKGKHNSLLGGKIFDSEGWAMSPSHSVKGGRRYRYYISQAYLQKEKDKAGNLPQIPAGNTEELASNEIRNLLKSQLANVEVGLEQGQAYKENWYKFVKDWSLLEPKIFILIRQILQKVVVSNKGLEFTIDQDNLKTIAELIFRGYDLPEELGKSGNTLSYTKLCKIEQVRHGKGFIIEGQSQRNESLVNALKQAWEWNDWIAEGKVGSIIELAEKLKITRRYVERILNMRYLSPKIQLMILKGTQPVSWTTHTFIKVLPSNWEEQSRELSL